MHALTTATHQSNQSLTAWLDWLSNPDRPLCVVHLAATLPGQDTTDLAEVVHRYESSLEVIIQPTERRNLLFTSSGKPRWCQMWSRYVNRRKTAEATRSRRPV